ncbi:MAG: hypothetical protein LUH11_01930 [Candidatus Gastranaerophilales bacterium]|nr:hypothetical protein [Candidatus Gastranaerophilales bacterium]
MYHGTKSNFDVFNKKGSSNSSTSRIGYWFSDSKEFAENFTKDSFYGDTDDRIVMPVYLSMKNPKVYTKRIVSQKELEEAKTKVKNIEKEIKEFTTRCNKLYSETGSWYEVNKTIGGDYYEEKQKLEKKLKKAEGEYGELKYTDPYFQLQTDIHKIDGGDANTANMGGGVGSALKDYDSPQKFVDSLKKQGYDGIIIKGTEADSEYSNDKPNNQYVVFEPEQIKSVDNQGTFDSNNPNIYYQSVYHGTPHRFDEFSTEHIGTGEGAQAHGWGLYFAEDKNVSEDYRETLAQSLKNAKYNGKLIYETELVKLDSDIKNILFLKGKKEALEKLEQNKKDAEKNINGNSNFLKRYSEKFLKNYDEQLEILKNVDESKITDVKKGQLFEVDIPEDDVLLDEDKTLSEQPEKVQKAIRQYFFSQYTGNPKDFNYEWILKYFGIETGRDFYETVAKLELEGYHKNPEKYEFQPAAIYLQNSQEKYELASKKLNSIGIKGITYNGRQDGRCYVVFDDKAVKVLKTYYQSVNNGKGLNNNVVDLTNDFEKTPSLDDVKKYINRLINEGVKFATSSPGWFVDIKGGKRIKNKILNAGNYKNLDKMERKRHNKYVMSLEKLLSNAVHTGEKENTKKDKKPDVEKYHYFKTTAKIGDKTYEIIFDTEEYKNDKTASVGHAKRDLKETEADINSITDNTEKINPKTVHLYNITELKPNNTYFYGESYDELLQKHNDKLEKQKDEYKGYFAEGLNAITLMDNADASTLPHELAHFFLASLNEFAKTSDKAREQLEEVDKRLGRIAGEDYTTEQHERFARWFEAYLYTGKSPSYRLKEVFENFKEWLKNIAEYWAQNYEMPKDVKKMFDRMFGEEQTLYNEEQEKKIKEALAKVESVTLSNKLTDRQKRHKEAAYQILAKATGLSKKYLMSVLEARNSNNKSIRKKQENIQMLLEHTDDKITVSDGMLLNWLEFYPDTGVSYDNQEVHADIELAQMAYDDIINGSWVTEVDEYDYINTADAQYQYLLKLFENGKNRDIIYSVFWKWLDNQDKFVQDIFAEQFENDMTQIEHKEHSLEFERIKQKILAEARKIDKNNDVDGVKRYKQIVLTTMKNLKFLTPEDKAAIATKIFDCPTLSFLEAKIDSILDMSKTLNERDYRRRLFSQIDKILEGTKNIQQGNKMVGRYDYTSNKIFESLRAINKLNGEAAKRYITDMQTLIDVENSEDSSGLSYEVKLCNMLAQIRAAGMKRPYKNTQLIKQFVDELNKMKLAARASVTEQQFLEKLDNQRDINEVINILTPMKSTALPVSIVDSIGKANFLKNVKTVLASHDSMGLKAKQLYTYTVANWESLVNTIFGKKIRNKYSMLQEQAQAAVWKDNMKKRFIEGAARIYNCKLRDFDNEILKNLSQVWEFQEAIRTKNPKGDYILNWTPIRMNKMEILLAWMWNKNDVLSERLKNQFGEQQLYDEMFDLLTDKDKEFGEFMMSLINEVYAPANERYIKKYGIELPKVQAYFPSSVERGSEIDLLSDYIMKSSAPSAIKTRSNATTLRMKFSNPVAIFFNHIDCMGDFICLTDKVDKINKVFRNPVVVSLIKNKFGDATFKELNQQIINFSYKKQADTANWLDKITSQVVNNWLSGTLSLKASVGFRQLLSAPNYAVNMPVVKWTAGFALAWLHPKETIDYMMKIPYLRVRFESSGQNEALQQFVNSVNISKIKKFKEFLMLNVRLGDIGAIIFGGKPYLDYLIKEKNMTEEAAIAAFVDQTNRTQQSSLGSSLSNFQTASKNRGISQLFTAYRNTQNQYIRLVADEIIDYRNAINNNEFANAKEKNEAKVKLAKTIFNYMFMQPLLYTLATTLSVNRAFNRSGDDDWKKDVLTSIFDLNAKAISLFGDLYQYIVQVIAGNSETAELVPIIGDFKTEINKAAKEDTRTEGILGLACVMTHAGIGVDVKTPINELSGVKDILDGDVQKGAYRILGNSEYRAKYAVGEE